MKILFDYQIFSLQKFGGISRYFVEIARRLSCFGEDVCVCAPVHKNYYLKNSGQHLSGGLCLNSFPSNTTRIINEVNRLLTRMIVSNWKPDIVHETYYNANSVAKKNIILTVYDMIHEVFPYSFSARDNTSVLKKAAVNRASRIICISNNTKHDLINHFNIDESKIFVVHLGFAEQVIESIKPVKMNFLDVPYLLYVGLRGGYKNFNAFIRAFASSSRLMQNFRIICFGGGDFTADERALLRKKGMSDKNISQLTGNDQDLAWLYQNARALVYPSLYEGFGLPPLEAMAYNCPVICSNTSSIPEVVGDAGEMFDPHDEESIRVSIERVLFNDSLCNELISRGKARLNMFSWERCARETLDVYRRVLS